MKKWNLNGEIVRAVASSEFRSEWRFRGGGAMKKWNLNGEIVRNEKKDIVKRVAEGIGDNKTYKTVKETVYVLVVLGEDGDRIRLQSPEPFDAIVGDDCQVEMRHGSQTRITEPKKKAEP